MTSLRFAMHYRAILNRTVFSGFSRIERGFNRKINCVNSINSHFNVFWNQIGIAQQDSQDKHVNCIHAFQSYFIQSYLFNQIKATLAQDITVPKKIPVPIHRPFQRKWNCFFPFMLKTSEHVSLFSDWTILANNLLLKIIIVSINILVRHGCTEMFVNVRGQHALKMLILLSRKDANNKYLKNIPNTPHFYQRNVYM